MGGVVDQIAVFADDVLDQEHVRESRAVGQDHPKRDQDARETSRPLCPRAHLDAAASAQAARRLVGTHDVGLIAYHERRERTNGADPLAGPAHLKIEQFREDR